MIHSQAFNTKQLFINLLDHIYEPAATQTPASSFLLHSPLTGPELEAIPYSVPHSDPQPRKTIQILTLSCT
jgi:hypothetical protein